MAERALLLGMMRGIRRRRRWMDGSAGAAFGLALAAPSVAALLPVLAARGWSPRVAPVMSALATAAVLGALVRAARRIPLGICARAVDRVRARDGGGTDDVVFAAVSFAEGAHEPAPTPFVEALTAEASARVRAVPARVVVPRPAPRVFVVAAAGVAGVVALLASPLGRASLSASAARGGGSAIDHATTSTGTAPPPVHLTRAALEAEDEETAAARAAARATEDEELARLADELGRLVTDLTRGVDAASAVTRTRALARAATDAATEGRAAAKAAAASRAALQAAARRGEVGGAAAALANALGEGSAQMDAAGAAASRLTEGGARGQAALARAAAAAAAALERGAPGGAGDGTATDDREGRDDEEPARRRLEDETPPVHGAASAGLDKGPPQRRLQQLRRELDRAATDCQRAPEACQRGAAAAGRALDQLERAGRAAEARGRLSQATQQLLDRLQRGGAGNAATEGRRLRAFSRAARGGTSPARAANAGDAPGPGGERHAGFPGAAAAGDAEASGNEDGAGDSSDAEMQGGGDDSGNGLPAGVASMGSNSEAGRGPAVGGPGAGSAPGGPVLGQRALGSSGRGRDAPTAVPSATAGPTRSAVIGGAAARGFASTEYRTVFTDYAGAVEESMDSAAVPPGRRYLVRRYFQLIRPRQP